MYRTARLALLSLLTFTPLSMAQTNDSNWFEIEVVVFERGATQSLREQFTGPVSVPRVSHTLDLISPLYHKDLTSVVNAMCGKSLLTESSKLPLAAMDFSAPLPESELLSDDFWAEYYVLQQPSIETETASNVDDVCTIAGDPAHPLLAPRLMTEPPTAMPVTPEGAPTHQDGPYLADSSAQKLKDLVYQLRHRGGHQLLLHTVVRSQLQPKRQSTAWRLVGGERFSPNWDSQGMPMLTQAEESPALQAAIDRTYRYLQAGGDLTRLNLQNPSLDQVWQLDGSLLVYSDRILSAELQLLLRQKHQPDQALSLYRLNRTTRLLLEEIHYIDHPKFGVVLQIRRFSPPLLPTETSETVN